MRSLQLAAILLLTTLLTVVLAPPDRLPAQETQLINDDITVVRAYFSDMDDFFAISADTDIWSVNHDEMYFETGATASEIALLEAQGFRVERDVAHTADMQRVESVARAGIPGYECYRTVEETFASAESLANDYPNLVRWLDVGDSWQKLSSGEGFDMHVLQITNFDRDPADKPKLFITSAIHAREYTTAELNTRFAEMLVNGYGVDADITWILDYHDVHLMLQANPDGRKIAESGLSKRKNMNVNYCGSSSVDRGIDLNRNFPYEWGAHNGSSGNQCSGTYRGPVASSEPETNAIVDHMHAIFPDQRADDMSSPAPDDATGLYMDIHSYSQLVLWPWGFPGVAPNGTALQTLGRKFAFFNGYEPTQSVNLYPTDGTTVDTAYGEFGVASYTFEMGTRFFQSCSSFENTIVPDNMPALRYAAKVARAPYLLPAGPDVVDLAVSQTNILAGEPFKVSAVVTDSRFNNQNGSEPTQNITTANLYFDAPSWEAGATAQAMSAVDGAFNSKQEAVELTLNAPTVEGTYTLFVEGVDANGDIGAPSAVFINVVPHDQANSFVISAPSESAFVGQAFVLPVSISNVPTVVADRIVVTVTFDDAILTPLACDTTATPFPVESCTFPTANTIEFIAEPQAEIGDRDLFYISFVGQRPADTAITLAGEISDAEGNPLVGIPLNSTMTLRSRVLLPVIVTE